jgi:hypothetical protein
MSADARARPLEFAIRCLYGLDIDELMAESAVFVLLNECLREATSLGIAPYAAWHALRPNIVAIDALRVDPTPRLSSARSSDEQLRREKMRTRLMDSENSELPEPLRVSSDFGVSEDWKQTFVQPMTTPLAHICPEAENGFDILVGNPPYAPLGPERQDLKILARQFASVRDREPTGKQEIYPLFVEMMWRLTKAGNSSSSLVTPLSIAFHQGHQFTACRKAMLNHGGRWSFAFFDREPHGLFEEDVKTRNAILFRHEDTHIQKRGTFSEFETTPLLKWTSRTRQRLFVSVPFTRMDGISIELGIPKIGGEFQARAYSALSRKEERFGHFVQHIRACDPIEATELQDRPLVFVSSTAYNFLNVYRTLTVDPTVNYPLAQNKVYKFVFRSEDDASMGLAILDSRLVYWLWLVLGDGFHVSLSFLRRIPINPKLFSKEHQTTLREAGDRLWSKVQRNRLVSINKGRQTIAYRPLAYETERDNIDAILLNEAGIPKAFSDELRTIVRARVVVDETDQRRRDLAQRSILQGVSP